MNRVTRLITGIFAALSIVLGSPGAAAGEPVTEFTGRDQRSNLAFSASGGWELQWEVDASSRPGPSNFELQLYDAGTGRFIGVVARETGSGSGVRHFGNGGRFFIDVVGRNVRWTIKVVDFDRPTGVIPAVPGEEQLIVEPVPHEHYR